MMEARFYWRSGAALARASILPAAPFLDRSGSRVNSNGSPIVTVERGAINSADPWKLALMT
jgi:hypothetical protein